MKTLVVRQTIPSGHTRTWRLKPGSVHTIGRSRLADLSSIDEKTSGIEGLFENRDGQWLWIPMNAKNLEQKEVEIQDSTNVKIGESSIEFGFHVKDESFIQKLENLSAPDSKPLAQIEVVKVHGHLFSTRLISAQEPKSTDHNFLKDHNENAVSVIRRPVALQPVQAFKSEALLKGDQEARRGTALVAICAVLFSAAALFGPKSSIHSQVTLPPQNLTFKIEPARPVAPTKKKSAPAPKIATQQNAQPQEMQNSTGQTKVAGMLKAINSGRISTLLGKVSAQAARSREVIVQKQGIKAGEGPSGQALSALGNVDRAGGDWSSSTQGTSVKVSKAARGAAGTGLSAGATGQGGVGLIENESEITGGLDRDVIAQVIKTYLGQILYCYERQLSAHPELYGKVAVRFTIGASGAVEAQSIGDTTLKNATVEGCMLNKIANWKFPTPQGGTKVMVTYPFLFKSTN